MVKDKMLIFIDDSGDPGFKLAKGSSRFFIIALIIFEDQLEAEKTSLAIKQLRRKLSVSDLYEFKFNKTDRKFRKEFFNAVKDFKFRARIIVVDKQLIYSQRLRTQIENFYNFIVMQVLRNNGGTIKNAKLKFDGRGERKLRNQLRAYLSTQLNSKGNNIFTDLKFVDSKQNTLIQLADMVAGAVHISFSGKNKTFLDILKERGRIDDIWEFKSI